MKRVIGFVVAALVALLLVLFAVSNRTPVELRLEPLPYSLTLPLYALLLATVVIGFVAGGITAFFANGRTRRRARRAETAAGRLQASLKSTRAELDKKLEAEMAQARAAQAGSAQSAAKGLPAPSGQIPALPKAG
jgi:uncharacterized integral membrane protein